MENIGEYVGLNERFYLKAEKIEGSDDFTTKIESSSIGALLIALLLVLKACAQYANISELNLATAIALLLAGEISPEEYKLIADLFGGSCAGGNE